MNPLTDNKILEQTKLEVFADDKLNVTKISVFDGVENIVGKRKITCTSNFPFSHNVFKRLLSQMCQKVSLCWNGLLVSQRGNLRDEQKKVYIQTLKYEVLKY